MMKRYILRKTIYLCSVMIGVSMLIFLVSQWIPGDAAEMILAQSGMDSTPDEILRIQEELGINRPLTQRYLTWMTGVIKGDFGLSYRSGRPVYEELKSRLPWTILLATVSLFLTILIAFPIGIISAIYEGKAMDYFTRFLSISFASVPSFLLGTYILYFFAVRGEYFNITGNSSARDVVLPSLTLALGMVPQYIRLLRTLILEALEEDYVDVARSRGLKESTILLSHALKRTLIPILTHLGISFGHLLGGTVIVENIFAWPGIGQFLILSIYSRDYPVIQAYVLWMALIFVIINAGVDYSCEQLNPQIKIGRLKK